MVKLTQIDDETQQQFENQSVAKTTTLSIKLVLKKNLMMMMNQILMILILKMKLY